MIPVSRASLLWGTVFIAVNLVLVGVVQSATPPPAGSITSLTNRHNMSSLTGGAGGHQGVRAVAGEDGTTQICIFCHTPHGAAEEGPLWNRSNPAGTFPLYGEGLGRTLAIKGDMPGQDQNAVTALTKYVNDPSVYPNGTSRLCLSCHDGVTAINILRDGSTIAMASTPALLDPDGSLKGSIAGGDAIGSVIDLSTAHPVSFVYQPTTGNPNAVVDLINTAYGAVNYTLPLSPLVDTPLDSKGRMQCTTCHDPHIDNRLTAGLPFWRQSVVRTGVDLYADVCNNCHTNPAISPLSPPVHPIP